MPGPRVTFLGGVQEIGGNKLLIEDGPDRLLFDFGPSFSPRFQDFYFDWLKPRSTSPVKDLLEFDLIPRIEGLYAPEALADSDLRYVPPEIHGLFVSHAHFDHVGYLRYVDPNIPLHVGGGTRKLMEAIEGSTPSTHYGEHPYRIFSDGKAVRVGQVEVVPLPVDHSIPGAYGFLVRTSEGTLVYTGDFRMHGPRAALTHQFLESAEQERPLSLVIEGTRAGPDPRKNFTEEGVQRGVDELLARTETLALASCYPRDIDRLGTLYRAARAAGRDLVVSLKTAHLLATIAGTPGLEGPVPGQSEGLRVYERPKRRYARWEKPFLDEAVDSDWVRDHGRQALLLLDLQHFTELVDLRPPRGAPFIHSMSEPFSEEDVNDQVLHNWLDHFGLGFHQFHASGHVSGPEIGQAVSSVQAASVFPVHTEHPEAFREFAPRIRAPQIGRSYAVDPRERE
ncbi:MAG TPA: MBL fold metallo-hydrolase [Thermoplasmata archaeon]|nr:MBL fold metallo-hydrolase [Thermoplasmata archaeon]